MKKIFLLGIISLAFISGAFAQDIIDEAWLDQVFGKKPEITISFPVQPVEVMEELRSVVSIDNVMNNEVIAVAGRKQFARFLEYNIPYNIITTLSDMVPPGARVMSDYLADKSTHAWDVYPTYQGYLDMMAQFAADYPALCRIDTIGYSVQGRLLLAAVISDNVNTPEYEPKFIYSSTMHGDETVGYVLMLRLIDYLLTNYGTIPDVTNLVNNVEIYISPNTNPDGTYYGGNNSVSGARRYNANNVDLNRNYPVPNGNIGDDGTYLLQPETQAFINYVSDKDFVMSANFHGGIELINYVWDYTYTNHPDKQWWLMVCNEYASSAQSNSPSGYFTAYQSGFDAPGITNGATWYVVEGSMQDYMHNNRFCRESTIELSNTKNPSSSTLPNYWNYNYQALLAYMEQVLYGFKGLVTDACSNSPIVAKIELIGHDAMNSHVFSSLPVGNYHRPVKAGTYTIVASAPGYISQQYTNVSITDYNTVVRNFQLMPEPPDVEFVADQLFSCDGIVAFQNNSSAYQDVVYTWHFGDGTTSYEENPVHTYTANGIYTVKLVAQSCAGNDSLIRTSYIEVEFSDPPQVADEFVCGAGTVTLTATSSSADIFWYDSTGTDLLATGSTFTTPWLSQTTQYLVSSADEALPCTGGKSDTIGPGGAFFTSNNQHGLIFDAHKPFTINSAEFYASSSGNRLIRVLDSDNNVLSSVTVYIPAGKNVVPLGLNVPSGNGHRLMGPSTSPNLYRNNTSPNNVGYPFELCDLMTITGSTAGNSYYYYFYNIEVEEQSVIFGGKTNNSTAGSYFTSANAHGLYFNCEEEVTLQSVKVYANSSGNRTISLLDGNDNTIVSETFNIPSGESRVELNFTIPAGNGLKLMGPVSPNLWRDGGSTAPALPYPFEVGDVISIYDNSADDFRYYYYFYDWEIVKNISGCESPKVPVTAEIIDQPAASFAWTQNCTDVGFLNQSDNGTSFFWDFGDGNVSYDENPSHVYAAEGTFTVMLTTANACDTVAYQSQIEVYSFEDVTIAEVCEGDAFQWRGSDYSVAGTYTDVYQTSTGCDSLFVLNLSINQTYQIVDDVEIYDHELPYEWEGIQYQAAGTYYANYQTVQGCDSILQLNLTVLASPVKTVQLTFFLESLYDGNSTMRKSQDVDLVTWDYVDRFSGDTADLVTIELWSDVGNHILTEQAALSTSGVVSLEIDGTINGNYYIYVRHRNSIAVSSAAPVSFSGSVISYDFSVSAASAFLDNQKDLGSGVYGLYGGDVDQDGSVGAFDLIMIDNAARTFTEGYVPEDVNGDGEVGVFDMVIVDNNTRNFVFEYLPF
jgi:PKD repeat protein